MKNLNYNYSTVKCHSSDEFDECCKKFRAFRWMPQSPMIVVHNPNGNSEDGWFVFFQTWMMVTDENGDPYVKRSILTKGIDFLTNLFKSLKFFKK